MIRNHFVEIRNEKIECEYKIYFGIKFVHKLKRQPNSFDWKIVDAAAIECFFVHENLLEFNLITITKL